MDELSSGISTCTLNEHIRSESDSSQVQHNILLLQLVAEISSQIDPAVIQDTRHIVQFAKVCFMLLCVTCYMCVTGGYTCFTLIYSLT